MRHPACQACPCLHAAAPVALSVAVPAVEVPVAVPVALQETVAEPAAAFLKAVAVPGCQTPRAAVRHAAQPLLVRRPAL